MEDPGLESLPPKFGLFCMHTCIVHTELFWFLVVFQNLLLCFLSSDVLFQIMSTSSFFLLSSSLFFSFISLFFLSFFTLSFFLLSFFPEEYEVALFKHKQLMIVPANAHWSYVSFFPLISSLTLFICHCPLFMPRWQVLWE